MVIRKRSQLVRLICEEAAAAELVEAVEMIIEAMEMIIATTMIGAEKEGAIGIEIRVVTDGMRVDIITTIAEATGAMVGAVEGGRRRTIVGGAIVMAATMGAGVGVDMNMNAEGVAAAAIGSSQMPPAQALSVRQLQSNHPGTRKEEATRDDS